jgi:hypothetical protein
MLRLPSASARCFPIHSHDRWPYIFNSMSRLVRWDSWRKAPIGRPAADALSAMSTALDFDPFRECPHPTTERPALLWNLQVSAESKLDHAPTNTSIWLNLNVAVSNL